MNPEFQRNLWLNLSTGRLIAMPLVIGAILFAASLLPDEVSGAAMAGTAELLFILIVIVWGTWLAARAVVSEIRDRTWDGQRMSAIAPWTMVWGKLFGSTIFVWYGGAFCLAVIVMQALGSDGPSAAVRQAAYWVSLGVFGHAVALLTSLLGVRRQSRHQRLEVFFYQIAGLVAVWFAASLWPGNLSVGLLPELRWFDMGYDPRLFFLVSIGLFIGWSLIGNNRLMRQELQFRNGPLVFVAFLVFLMAYYAGFVSTYDQIALAPDDLWTIRLYVAGLVAGAMTYIMVFLDAKEPVTLRWIGGQALRGNIVGALWRLPSWGWALLISLVMAGLMILMTEPLALDRVDLGEGVTARIDIDEIPKFFEARPLILAAALFLIRDVAIVLAFNAGARTGRGDFAALVTLFALYVIVPVILVGIGQRGLLPFVAPSLQDNALWTIVPPAIGAGLMVMLAVARINAVRRG